MIKYFSAHIKRSLTLKVECSVSAYWEFFNDNLIWLKEIETSHTGSCDIKTRISEVPVVDTTFINSITKGYDRLGYKLFVKDSSVICIYGDWLLWKYEIGQNGEININIYYTAQDDNYLIKLARRVLRGISPKQIKREKFLYLTRIGIHFPVFLFLRVNENIEIMHAAAVGKDDHAIVLAGYDGVGKSTLAMYLCIKNNFQYIADNFLLYDEKYVYPFVESARLSKDSIKQLGLPNTGKRIHGRTEVLPQFYTSHSPVSALAIFFNYISDEDFSEKIEKIDKKKLKNKILAMENYLPEFIHYKEFVSVVKLAINIPCRGRKHPLDEFLNNRRLYLLKKYKMENIPDIAEKVVGCVHAGN